MKSFFPRPLFSDSSKPDNPSHRRRATRHEPNRQSIEPLEPRHLLTVTFGSPQLLNGVTIGPYAVVDLNGDGKPDLVGVCAGTGIEIFVNQGNGTFASPIIVPNSTNASATGMAIGDFNGDGVPDIAVMSGNNTVSCFLGAGTNVNGANPSYLAPVVSSYAVVSGDAAPQSSLKPAATSTSTINAPTTTSQLQTAHFGGSMDDLVVDDAANGNLVQVLLATGAGHFQTDTANILAGPGDAEIHLLNRFVIADFNGDGVSDIAYVGLVGNNYGVIVQFGAQGGTFLTSQYGYAVPNGGPIYLIAATLTSPSGLPDLVCNDENFANVDVLLNNGAGSFGTATAYPTTDSQNISVGDFDANGALDISAGSQILFNTGAGTFSPAQTIDSLNLVGTPRLSVDINDDGHADLIEYGPNVQIEGASNSGGGGGSGSDLSGALTGPTPASAIVGQKTKISQSLKLTAGANLQSNLTGQLFLSSDGTIDGSSIPLDPLQTKKNLKLKLNAHTSFSLKATAIPSSTPSGTYQLIAQITDSIGTTDITGSTITIAPAQIDLTGSFTKQPLPAKHGKTTLALSLSNAGNIPATGLLEVNIETSPDGQLADATPLPPQSKKISLKPNTKPQKITLTVALPAGTYFLLIQLDPQNTFHDINLTNNLFTTSLPLTVA